MTKDEQYEYCRTITVAARRMGFGARDDSYDGLYQFSWMDLVGGLMVTGNKCVDRQDAYQSACEKLVDHVQIKPTNENDKQPNPSPAL